MDAVVQYYIVPQNRQTGSSKLTFAVLVATSRRIEPKNKEGKRHINLERNVSTQTKQDVRKVVEVERDFKRGRPCEIITR